MTVLLTSIALCAGAAWLCMAEEEVFFKEKNGDFAEKFPVPVTFSSANVTFVLQLKKTIAKYTILI